MNMKKNKKKKNSIKLQQTFEKEYEIEGKEIFGLEKEEDYKDLLKKILEIGEYNYEKPL